MTLGSDAHIMPLNRPALAYLQANGYTRKTVDDLCVALDVENLLARVEFLPGRLPNFTVSTLVGKTKEGHYPTISKFMCRLVTHFGCDDLSGTLAVWLHDGAPPVAAGSSFVRTLPLLTFGRTHSDPWSFLMPDPAFLGDQGYQTERAEIDRVLKELPWHQRTPTAIWRGASTGCGGYQNWTEAPRIQLTALAKRMNQPSRLDAKISKVAEYNDPHRYDKMSELGLLGDYLPLLEMLKYRYQIDVDGECCAWISFFLKLYSGNVVIKAHSDWLQWYYDQLLPWIHYIPVNKNFSDMPELLSWIESHDEPCRRIAEQARAQMQSITYETSCRDMASLIRAILACQTG